MKKLKHPLRCLECGSLMHKRAQCPTCGTDLSGKEPRRDAIYSRRKIGIEVQVWGIDSNNNVVTAGVDFVPEISAKWLANLFTRWRRWRAWYDGLPRLLRDRRYQDMRANIRPVVFYGAHPIDEPKAARWLNVSTL